MYIYLAADYARKDEMQGCRDVLEALGHQITSRWIDNSDSIEGAGIGTKMISPDRLPELSKFAEKDYEDIVACDTLILFTTGEKTRGGRHTEFGIALALRKGLIIIGPREHVFHCPEWIKHYLTWRSFMVKFSQGRE